MDKPPVSVIVVSRERPQALTRCLRGLSQLDYPQVEVVVVACPAGAATVRATPQAEQIKLVEFDEPNISAARNAGIAVAAGEIVAFIDDDAVPEPLWLHHLIAPFEQPEIAATGGYVIGRNGISFQWKVRSVDVFGEAAELALDGTGPVVLTPTPDRAIKTEGTNMALRRETLCELGGFDSGFQFYLDETDLNMRLAKAGLATAIVPLAQVHHGFEESARRGRDRTPRDLTQIGASKMLFLRKHAPKRRIKSAWKAFRRAQRLRLLRLMQHGPLAPDDVWRLLRGLDRGRAEGAERPVATLPPIPRAAEGFRAFPTRPGATRRVLAGRFWQAGRLRAEAAEHARRGEIVSLYLFSPTPRYHRVRFAEEGYWEQIGGRFGRSLRDQPLIRYRRFSKRLRMEQNRVKDVRGPTPDHA